MFEHFLRRLIVIGQLFDELLENFESLRHLRIHRLIDQLSLFPSLLLLKAPFPKFLQETRLPDYKKGDRRADHNYG